MAITINGVTYRNLQQQVLWLTKKVEELIDAGGGYTAGYGIDITEGTIAADLTEVQQKLVAGPNITINGNVISATNGGGGGSSKEVTDIDFPYGDATVSYDTTDGMTITGTAKLTFDDGSTVNANCDVEVPFVPGAGITMDADSTGKKVVIKAIAADYVSLTLPSGATSGTITSAQLATLQSNDTAYIIINGKELYYLADKNTVNGILTYTHNGYNEAGVQKYFNLTVSTRAFTINQEESIIQYVDISSATGTINANDMILISDPTGLNCVRYNGYVLRFVRKVSNNYGVYYYSCLAGVTSYWLSITKDSTGAGIYVVNTYDLSEGGGSSKEYQAGTGITFSDYNNITTISADIVQNSGLKFTGPLQGEKLTIDDTVIQKKLTDGTGITINDSNTISADFTKVQKKLVAGDGIVINTGTTTDTIVADAPISVIKAGRGSTPQTIPGESMSVFYKAIQEFPNRHIIIQSNLGADVEDVTLQVCKVTETSTGVYKVKAIGYYDSFPTTGSQVIEVTYTDVKASDTYKGGSITRHPLIPNPSSSGTYILQSTNGTITWIQTA